ncbi:MAG TPA: large conductance mechanosensitive channel protein MscL, partial [Gammaproteobacteria bacterium]|nr:large conductance mechanosensitive channel protein MscL [Gammaproteobacteria bacterium]
MSLFQEFKKFAVKGNVIDMAVGIIIGAAFGKITTSLVNGIIMPPIGVIIGNVDFTQLSWVIQEATADQPAVMINYGDFLQTVINFII